MKAIKSISAVLLALLVLVSSTNFIVGMHICMGKVQKVAVFAKAEGCGMQETLPPCHREMKAACCQDETIVHQGDDFKISTLHQIIAPSSIDIVQPLVFISEVIPSQNISRTRYHNYDPPLRSYDLTVAHRVFLI